MVYRDLTPLDPERDYTAEELAKFILEKMYGEHTREAMARSLLKANEVAEWSREVAQQIVDGSFDEGALNTAIEQKLNDLEQEYAPQLSTIKNEVEDARGNEPSLGDRLDGVNSQLAQTMDETVNAPTKLMAKGIAFEHENNHASWTQSNVRWDNESKEFFVIYNTQPSHSLTDNVVYIRKYTEKGGFSGSVKIADLRSSGISCKCQSSGIDVNGNWIAIVARIQNDVALGTWVYRSTDKGVTWDSGTEILINGQPVLAWNGDVTGFITLKSGRILLFLWTPVEGYAKTLYSDDNGFTWYWGVIGDGQQQYWMEPALVELSNGTIIALFRNALGGENTEDPAGFSKSVDGGLTFSNIVNSKTILDMNNNNGNFIVHEDSGMIEFIYGSRCTQPDGHTSIYQCICTEEEAENDNFGTQYRIAKGPAYKYEEDFGKRNDFGYVGAAKSDDDTVLVCYFAGTTIYSSIHYMIGSRKTNLSNMQPEEEFKPTTTELINTSQYFKLLYDKGDMKESLTGGWIQGYCTGDYFTDIYSGDWLEIGYSATDQITRNHNASFITKNGVDVTYVDYINMLVYVSENNGGNVSIFVYDNNNPTGASDGRLKYIETKKLGLNIITIDVSDLSGIVYPSFMANVFGTGKVKAYLYKAWSDRKDYLIVGDFLHLMSDNPMRKEKNYLYQEGTEKTILSGGWIDNIYDLNYGTSIKNNDNLEVSVTTNTGEEFKESRKSFWTHSPIDLTNVRFIYAKMMISDISGIGDVGVSVFSENNPVLGDWTDGRVDYNYTSQTGLQTIKLDVAEIVGNHYVVLSANKSGIDSAGTAKANIYEVWYE